MDHKPFKLNSQIFTNLHKLISEQSFLLIENIFGSAKAHMLSNIFQEQRKNILIITEENSSDSWLDDLNCFLSKKDIKIFPASEKDSFLNTINLDAIGIRNTLLQTLLKPHEPICCITSLPALLEKLPPTVHTQNSYLQLQLKELISLEDFVDLCLSLGYKKQYIVTEKGGLAVRGGIVDIFPISEKEPLRIEFWEDSILSMRKYNAQNQLSTEKISEITITDANVSFSSSAFKSHFFDYISTNTIVIWDNIYNLEDKYSLIAGNVRTFKENFFSIKEMLEFTKTMTNIFFSDKALDQASCANFEKNKVKINLFCEELCVQRYSSPYLSLASLPYADLKDNFSLETLIVALKLSNDHLDKILKKTLIFFYEKEHEKLLVEDIIQKLGQEYFSLYTYKQSLSSGFYLVQEKLACISTVEFSKHKKLRREAQRVYHKASAKNEDLYTPKVGETIVHAYNGIGRFLGVTKKPNHLGHETEYMILEYADQARLYVPLEQAYLISKYTGTNTNQVNLHNLQGKKWSKITAQTEKSLLKYAEDLLKIQAERSLQQGISYGKDSKYVIQFSESFPYQETPDQLAAIQDIYNDMQSNKIMDRLICGDAGFGKTEIAMRAAIKAVCDGSFQVVVMVPTTVLALQHYENFTQRMSGLPVNIVSLSRLTSNKEKRLVLQNISEGKVDIVIGTHRVIGKDVVFKNLGLLIIDEEQRFGVKIKEHFKNTFPKVDCLTLSATPIPRTLYLSLVGARDLSILTTPPMDRLPISTTIHQRSDEIFINAIRHELLRGGQTYVIHNRIETLFETAEKIRSLVPEAKVVAVHGQMAKELPLILQLFKSGQTNVLVATSLIENGIDIPNANSILIDQADKFGLADLYQMRGRVGRWNRKAYCYLLVSHLHSLSGITGKRLSALTQNNYGEGMKIALQDLEIRGAGNILGTEQSGHVTSVGFQLYCRLLKKAIKSIQNKETPNLFQKEVKIEFPFFAKIPSNYIDDVNLRMEMYQKIGQPEDVEELHEIKLELIDRFGPLPEETEWLFVLSELKIFATHNYFSIIKGSDSFLYVEQIHNKSEKITKKIPCSLERQPKNFVDSVIKILSQCFPLKQ